MSVSGNAFEKIRGKTKFAFDDLGEKTLKNIVRPVRLYAVRGAAAASSTPPTCEDKTAFGFLQTPQPPSFLVDELRRKIIGKGSYLERQATAARVDRVQFDRIELIIGKDRGDLACLELGPAHPSRGDGNSKPCFGAGNDAVG